MSSSLAETTALALADELERVRAERDYLADTLDATRRAVRAALVDIATDALVEAGAKLNHCATSILVAQQDVAELTSDRWRYHGTPAEDAALIATTEAWGESVSPKTRLAVIAAKRRQAERAAAQQMTLTDGHAATGDDTRHVGAGTGDPSITDAHGATHS